MLKTKTRRICRSMTAGAAFVIHVIEKPSANCPFSRVFNLRKVYIRRRIRGRLAHKDLEELYAALSGRRSSRVRVERQEADLRENTRSLGRFREGVRSP